ncbi:MAG: DUF3021 domain-containing protein [Clostridia bacterium]|nr:DUF3021 domain-containing protein [Clostridia bacterium]
MKKFILDFLRRGLIACGIGPVILAILYLILKQTSDIETLSVNQVCVGIFSITALAFIAGGMNAVYQIERLPLMAAILIHGVVLYAGYFCTYLLNDWLEWGVISILVFSGIFVVGFVAIWAVIYSILKRNTEKLNKMLKQKQQSAKGE